MKPALQNANVTDEVLLEKMTAAYSLETERKNKLSATSKAKMVNVAAVSEENEEVDKESGAHKASSKNKQSEITKRDTLMEKIDQGNKAMCEALQNLTTHVASLQQTFTPPPARVSGQPERKYRPQPKNTNIKRCQQCQASNPDGRCDHCYKCGTTETLGFRLS